MTKQLSVDEINRLLEDAARTSRHYSGQAPRSTGGSPIHRANRELEENYRAKRPAEPSMDEVAELFGRDSCCSQCQQPVPPEEIVDGRCSICRLKEIPDYSEPWGKVVVCEVCGTRHSSDDFCMTCYLRAQERAAGCE